MLLSIDVHLRYELSQPTDLLLQIEVPHMADQEVSDRDLQFGDTEHCARVASEEGYGERIWLRTAAEFDCTYSTKVLVNRPVLDISLQRRVPPHLLPGDTVRYLMPSRYCPASEFQSFVAAEFGHLSGGERVQAMASWIHDKFSYQAGASDGQTTAMETFIKRQGVCRDFAHVLITFSRASGIPARFASVYAPDVKPQDFHAVAEVYLNSTWHLVDATKMASADEMARIGVGTDAAEVAFLNSFSPIKMLSQSVAVCRRDSDP